jgi:hypothetical protein
MIWALDEGGLSTPFASQFNSKRTEPEQVAQLSNHQHLQGSVQPASSLCGCDSVGEQDVEYNIVAQGA